MDHPPPGDAATPQGHDPPHLARAALAQVLGDVAVRHHPAGRDGVDDVEHTVGEVRHLGRAASGHGPGGGQGGPDEPGSAGARWRNLRRRTGPAAGKAACRWDREPAGPVRPEGCTAADARPGPGLASGHGSRPGPGSLPGRDPLPSQALAPAQPLSGRARLCLASHDPLPGRDPWSCPPRRPAMACGRTSPADRASGLRVRRTAANTATARQASASAAYRASRPACPAARRAPARVLPDPPPKCAATFTPRPVFTSRPRTAGGGQRRGRVDGAEPDPVVVSLGRRVLGGGGDGLVHQRRARGGGSAT